MKLRKHFLILVLFAAIVASSCSYNRSPKSPLYDPNNPGFEYAPAMYHSWPYEPLTQVTDPSATSWYKNTMPFNDYNGEVNSNSLTPVEGTIARGKLAYYISFENNDAGRAKAAAELENTVPLNDFTLMEGKRLYNLYCDHCHGETGNGKGSIVEAEKYPTMGAYYDKLKDIEAGSIYHTITYGKGLMGAHASQLSPEQRWKMIHWVQTLQMDAEAYKVTSVAERKALANGSSTENTEMEMESSTDSTAVDSTMQVVIPDTANVEDVAPATNPTGDEMQADEG